MRLTKLLFLIAMTIGVVGKEADTAFAYSPAHSGSVAAAMGSLERDQTLYAQFPFPFPFPRSHDRNGDWSDHQDWDHRDWDNHRDSIDYCLDKDGHDDRRRCFDRLLNTRNDNDWRDRSDEIEGCLDRDTRDDRHSCFERLREHTHDDHWSDRDNRWYRNDRVSPFPPRRFPF